MKKLLIALLFCRAFSYAAPKLPPTKNYGLFLKKPVQSIPVPAPEPEPPVPEPEPPAPEPEPPAPEPEPPAPEPEPPALEPEPPAPEPEPPAPEPEPPAPEPEPIAPQPLPEFFAAIRAGEADTVRNFLMEGISPNMREQGQGGQNDQGASALIAAVGARQEAIVRMLLAEGADANASAGANGVSGLTPLMVAAQNGVLLIIEALITAGANVNAVTSGASSGNTALMAAASYKQTAALEFLILNGADINAKNASGCSTLMIAAQTGNIDALKILLKMPGIRIRDTDSKGVDALGFARKAGQKEAERMIYYTR